MNVSYLGPKGTFSEIAVAHYFSENINKHPKSSIEDVFKLKVINNYFCNNSSSLVTNNLIKLISNLKESNGIPRMLYKKNLKKGGAANEE